MANDTPPAANSDRTLVFDEWALVERCRNGEAAAFAELAREYQDRIYNLIFRMCHRAEDAEELAQETFLKAFEKIGQFRGTSRFYTWLFRIAKNLTISHCRRRGKVKFIPLTQPDSDDPAPGEALTAATAMRREPSPEEQAISQETADRIASALGDRKSTRLNSSHYS